MPGKDRFKFFGAVFLLLKKENQILLMRRFNTGYEDGNYALPSGHLEENETAINRVIIEAKEEIGIEVKPDSLKVFHVMHRISPEREYFDIYLSADKYSGEIANLEPDKCDDIKWFSTTELPENVVPELKLALEKIEKIYFIANLVINKRPQDRFFYKKVWGYEKIFAYCLVFFFLNRIF